MDFGRERVEVLAVLKGKPRLKCSPRALECLAIGIVGVGVGLRPAFLVDGMAVQISALLGALQRADKVLGVGLRLLQTDTGDVFVVTRDCARQLCRSPILVDVSYSLTTPQVMTGTDMVAMNTQLASLRETIQTQLELTSHDSPASLSLALAPAPMVYGWLCGFPVLYVTSDPANCLSLCPLTLVTVCTPQDDIFSFSYPTALAPALGERVNQWWSSLSATHPFLTRRDGATVLPSVPL